MAMSPKSHFLHLPLEIVIHILGKLPCVSLLRLSQCCRFIHAVVRETVSLQYEISLTAINSSEHVNLPQSNMRERLNQLRRRELAWANFRWHDRGFVDLASDSGIYELQHGIFIQGLRRAGTPLGMLSNGVRMIHLPRSMDSDAKGDEFALETYGLGFDFADFNIDPEQNLAVYACFEVSNDPQANILTYVRIRQLSNGGKAHPHARFERLELGNTVFPNLTFIIQIFGDFVGILIRTSFWALDERRDSEFYLYNWKTGTLQTHCKHAHVDGFIILSPYYFMLVSSRDPLALLIYYLQPRRVVGLPPPPKPPRCVVTYLLPRMHPLAHMTGDFICRCEPTPVFEPPNYVVEGTLETGDSPIDTEGATPTVRYAGSRPTVRPGQDDFRVAVLAFCAQREATQEHFIGFIAISELFKEAQNLNAPFVNLKGGVMHESHTGRLRPWDEWGPEWTRILPGAVPRSWVCCIFMTRFVFITPEPPLSIYEGDDEEPTVSHRNGAYIGVLDFNPHGLHESYPARNGAWLSSPEGLNFASSEALQETPNFRAFDHTQGIPVGNDLFESPIVSYLPFRRFSSYQRINGGMLPMIDAERIFLVEDDVDGNPSSLQVLSF